MPCHDDGRCAEIQAISSLHSICPPSSPPICLSFYPNSIDIYPTDQLGNIAPYYSMFYQLRPVLAMYSWKLIPPRYLAVMLNLDLDREPGYTVTLIEMHLRSPRGGRDGRIRRRRGRIAPGFAINTRDRAHMEFELRRSGHGNYKTGFRVSTVCNYYGKRPRVWYDPDVAWCGMIIVSKLEDLPSWVYMITKFFSAQFSVA